MAKKSAGIILYQHDGEVVKVLLVHPGGPFWAKKDLAAWSIPKGEFDEKEDPREAAKREVAEETGIDLESLRGGESSWIELAPVKQKSGKIIYAWGAQANDNTLFIKSNFFEMEWPPKSGKYQSFAEVDKAEWFTLDQAKEKIIPGQVPLLEDLEHRLMKKKSFSL